MTCRTGNKIPAATGAGRSVIYYPPGPAAATICTIRTAPSPLFPPRITIAYFPGSGMYVEHPRTSDIASYTTTPVGQDVMYSAGLWLGSLSAISTRLLRPPSLTDSPSPYKNKYEIAF